MLHRTAHLCGGIWVDDGRKWTDRSRVEHVFFHHFILKMMMKKKSISREGNKWIVMIMYKIYSDDTTSQRTAPLHIGSCIGTQWGRNRVSHGWISSQLQSNRTAERLSQSTPV